MIQVTAAMSGIRGVLWLQKKRSAIILGGAITIISFGWFFYWYLSLASQQLRGLEGVEQSILFATTALIATVFNYVIAALIQRATNVEIQEKRSGKDSLPTNGIEMLKTSNLMTLIYTRRNNRNV